MSLGEEGPVSIISPAFLWENLLPRDGGHILNLKNQRPWNWVSPISLSPLGLLFATVTLELCLC